MRDRAQNAVVQLRGQVHGLGLERLSTRLGITLLIVSAIFFAANFADKAWLSYQVAQERHQREAQIQQITAQINTVQRDLNYMKTRAYYVQAARDLGFVQPGDVQLNIKVAPAPAVTGDFSEVQRAPAPLARHESLLDKIMRLIVPGV